MPESKTTIPGLLPELSFRPCCLLAEKLGLIHDIPVFGHIWPKIMVDLSGDALRHRAGTGLLGIILRRERSGIVYSCAGGFVDLGHLRDFADLTRQYYWGLVRLRKDGVVPGATAFPLLQTHGGIVGEVILQRDLPAADLEDLDGLINVARSIAYDVSVMYEIKTYGEDRVGGRSSAFSPEDLFSNYMGTYVGGRALKRQITNSLDLPTEGEPELATTFDVAVTEELEELLVKLKVVTHEQTLVAFSKIDGRWVKSEFPRPNFLDVNYLRRRNFEVRPVRPWLAPELGFCVDTDFPEEVDLELPPEAVSATLAHYEFTSTFYQNLIFLNRDFNQYIDKAKADARIRYGDDFDKP